jgi:hypothetical protein
VRAGEREGKRLREREKCGFVLLEELVRSRCSWLDKYLEISCRGVVWRPSA